MIRLGFLFFMLPWWAYFPAAALVGYLTEVYYHEQVEEERAREAALQSPPPAPVDLGDFRRDRDITDAREANVVGWANYEYNYELVKKTNGITTDRHFMIVLFGAQDDADSKVARAVLVMRPDERDWFLEHSQDFIDVAASSGSGFGRDFYRFNGFAKTSSAASGLVSDALRDEGLTKAPDFVYLTPFFFGRAEALTPHGASGAARRYGWGLVAVMLLLALFKFSKSRAARGDAFAAGPIASKPRAAQPKQAPQPLAASIAPDSPMGRLHQAQLAQARQAQTTTEPQQSPRKRSAIAKGVRTRGRSKVMLFLAVGAALLLLVIFVPTLGILIMPLGMIAGFWFLVYRGATALSDGFGALISRPAKAQDPFDRLQERLHPGE